MSHKPPRKPRRKINGQLDSINQARAALSADMGKHAFDMRCRCLSLEQMQTELVKLGFPKRSLSQIAQAWKAYAAARPSEEVEDRRRAELERIDERERRLRAYIDLVDAKGQPVIPSIKVALDVESRLATICQQRIHLAGMAIPVRDEGGEKSGGPVTVNVVYPSDLKKSDDGAGPAPDPVG